MLFLFTVIAARTCDASSAVSRPCYFLPAMIIARRICTTALTLLVAGLSNLTEATRAEQGPPTLWSHNGSVLYLIKNGRGREFHYKEPRPEMIQAGAYRGALLFAGQSNNHQYSG